MTEQRTNFWVKASPTQTYQEVRLALLAEIEAKKQQHIAQFGDEPIEVVLLIDDLGSGPRGYITQGVLYHKLRGAKND